jgi:hypothetical protein
MFSHFTCLCNQHVAHELLVERACRSGFCCGVLVDLSVLRNKKKRQLQSCRNYHVVGHCTTLLDEHQVWVKNKETELDKKSCIYLQGI